MNWLQIRFTITSSLQDKLESLLLEAGALSITLQDAADQPILEPELNQTPVWDQLTLTALFTADTPTDSVIEQIESALEESLPPFKIDILEDKDWIREWMDSYKPIQFGSKLWICPSWSKPTDESAVNLFLDPGLAFGTGTHPTTAMCLKQLDTFPIENKTVIDFGCGSGILAIASILLGAKEAIAIDNDPQAIAATNNNARNNHILHPQIKSYLPTDAPSDIKADLVIANILANPLLQLCHQLTRLTKINGYILLSGILSEQRQTIIAAYSQFEFVEILTDNDWVCLLGQHIKT